jgi:hypothetical protein
VNRICLLGLALLVGCNTAPVGFDQLHGRIPDARDTTMTPDSIASYARYVPLGQSTLLFLGRDDQYVARVLMKFALPDTLTLDSVASVQLVVQPGESTRMSFVCYPCSTSWDSSNATWLMADDANHWYRPGGDYWPDSIGGGLLEDDTLAIDIRYLEMDTLVRQAIRQNGILIIPRDTGFSSIWSATASTALKPSIRIIYRSNADTASFDAYAAAPLIDTLPGAVRPNDLFVGSGVALRTWLRFDLDSIPSAATIARAELSFRPDLRYRRADSLPMAVHRLTESFAVKGLHARYDAIASASLTFVPASDTDTVVRFDIRNLVQYWTAGRDSTGRDTSNEGMLIMSEPEYSRLFRVRVPRSGPGAPRLRIEYVLPPEDRFW